MLNPDQSLVNIDIDDPRIRLEVGMAVEEICPPEWDWLQTPDFWGGIPNILIWVVIRGTARLGHGEHFYDVRRGDFFVMPLLGKTYRGTHDPKDPLEVAWLAFTARGEDGNVIPMTGIEGLSDHVKLSDFHLPKKLMDRTLEAKNAGEKEIWLRSLLSEVKIQARASRGAETDWAIQELGSRIESKPGRYRNLDPMCRELSLSKDQLIRRFSRYFGVTPIEFLIRSRIAVAETLLGSAGHLSIKQIGCQVGYPDLFSFSRQFKKRSGRSPTEYRRLVNS